MQAKANPPQVTFNASDMRRLEALHDGEISQHDHHFARFIQTLKDQGLYENTAIVFVADHGEEFREHGSFGHGHSVYEELLHVPLIVRAPGVSARRVSTRVSTIDVPATIVELAGLPAMPNTFSRSLVPLMAGGTRSGPEVAMAEFLDERRVIYAGQYKFFVRGNLTASMFDLGTDPGEQNQLEVSAHPIAARYLRTLQGQFLGASNRSQWLSAEQAGSARLDAGEVQMDGELQQQLRELGYLN
ncbi:MAG: sulfatase-like hydrolase/transferase [Sandaracinus sp.]|nr:sulfatase-like hydrolase/transferase [Sandaracinus sp.]